MNVGENDFAVKRRRIYSLMLVFYIGMVIFSIMS